MIATSTAAPLRLDEIRQGYVAWIVKAILFVTAFCFLAAWSMKGGLDGGRLYGFAIGAIPLGLAAALNIFINRDSQGYAENLFPRVTASSGVSLTILAGLASMAGIVSAPYFLAVAVMAHVTCGDRKGTLVFVAATLAVMFSFIVFGLNAFPVSAFLVVAGAGFVAVHLTVVISDMVSTAESMADGALADAQKIRLALVDRSAEVMTRDEFTSVTSGLIDRLQSRLGERLAAVLVNLSSVAGAIKAIGSVASKLASTGVSLAGAIDQSKGIGSFSDACRSMGEGLDTLASNLAKANLEVRGNTDEIVATDVLISALHDDLDRIESQTADIDRALVKDPANPLLESVRNNLFALRSALTRTLTLLEQRLKRIADAQIAMASKAQALSDEASDNAKAMLGLGSRMGDIAGTVQAHMSEIRALTHDATHVNQMLDEARGQVEALVDNSREIIPLFRHIIDSAARDISLRRDPRVPANFSVLIKQGGGHFTGTAINISAHGILVAPHGISDVKLGAAAIDIKGLGLTPCYVISRSDVGFHIRFDDITAAFRKRVEDYVADTLTNTTRRK